MLPYKDLAPKAKFGWMTLALILANLGIFLYQLTLPTNEGLALLQNYALIPMEFRVGHNLQFSNQVPFYATLITSLFLHGGWFHLLSNLLYLWIFGDNVENKLGSLHFLFFYLFCGVVGSLFQVYSDMNTQTPLLGASGAISGVLAAYLRYFPRAKIAALIPFVYILRPVVLPAWVVLGFWVATQVIEAQYATKGLSGIAYFSHLGGFAAGFLFAPLFISKVIPKKGRR